jgi:hypothetical protein
MNLICWFRDHRPCQCWMCWDEGLTVCSRCRTALSLPISGEILAARYVRPRAKRDARRLPQPRSHP